MRSKKQGWLASSCLLVLLLTAGCREKGAQLQSSATPPDKELFKNGQEWLDKSQYLKARLAFQTLINTYPDSELTPESFFNIAESYYDEGGKEALLQAEAQYKDFMVFYPTHKRTAEAQLKTAALNMKMIEDPDRDPTYALRAEKELKTFLEKFPKHELEPEIRDNLKRVQDVLAAGEYGKGQFYHRHKNYKASLSRYQDIVKNYPKYGNMDTVLYEIAEALIELKRPEEEVVPVLTRLAGQYESPKAEAAKKLLAKLEKPVPPPDPIMIAEHERLRKPKEPLIKGPKEIAGMLANTFRGPKDPVKDMLVRRDERLASAASAPPAGVASASDPRPTPDINLQIKVPEGSAPPSGAVSPASSKTNVSNPTDTPGTNGNPAPSDGSVSSPSPAGPEVKRNPDNRPPDLGNRENTNAPKKKRGLFKRILRTGN